MALSLLLLCGCSDSGSYVYSRQHISPVSSEEKTQNGISTREQLTEAISSMLRAAVESDMLRIYDYQGDLDTDLEEITGELTKVYPYGVYAVSSIVFKQVTILSHTELSVSIQYSRTAREITSVVEAPTSADLTLRITEAFDTFSSGKAFFFSSVGVPNPEAMIQKCWLQNPGNAIGLKSVAVELYPEVGEDRILALSAEYLEDVTTLKAQRDEILNAAQAICKDYSGISDRDKLDFIYAYLRDNVTYDTDAARVVAETGGQQAKSPLYTAYGGLIEQHAAQSGIALAAKALCDALGMRSIVVSGMKSSEPYIWLVVNTDKGSLFFDPTSNYQAEKDAPITYLFTHGEARRLFSWNKSLYGVY